MNVDSLLKKTTDIMYGDAGVSGTAQYMSQLVWILFLKVFDYKEEMWELEKGYKNIIREPFRFRDWANPKDKNGRPDLKNRMTADRLINFINMYLFPYLSGKETEYEGKKYLLSTKDAKAAIIIEFMSSSQNYMTDGVKLRQIIDEMASFDFDNTNEKHEFNDFYEKYLFKLQYNGNEAGEFYTPRPLTHFITKHVNPKIGENVADFACGSAGFLVEAANHLQGQVKSKKDNETIKKSIYGIEWKKLPYTLATTNLLLHNIDNPNLVHGDGLAKNVLDLKDEDLFDCILMNPPFGGEINKSVLQNFPEDIRSSESADLFLIRIIYCLKKNGRCGLILPDGVLFQTSKQKTLLKKKLLETCNLHTIIRVPKSTFAPYTPTATNMLFFEKTGKTKEVWYYRIDMPEGVKHFSKTKPIKLSDLDCVEKWWNKRVEIKDECIDESKQTYKSKKYTIKEIEDMNYNLDLCGYPNVEEEILTPKETIENYFEKKQELEKEIKKHLDAIKKLIEV